MGMDNVGERPTWGVTRSAWRAYSEVRKTVCQRETGTRIIGAVAILGHVLVVWPRRTM